MKFATTILALASLAFEVSAFPAEFKARFAEAAAHAEAAGLPSPEGCPYAKKALEKRDLEKNDLGKRVFGVAPGFDPATQVQHPYFGSEWLLTTCAVCQHNWKSRICSSRTRRRSRSMPRIECYGKSQ